MAEVDWRVGRWGRFSPLFGLTFTSTFYRLLGSGCGLTIGLALDALGNLCPLSNAIAYVVELAPANLASARDLDLLNPR